MRGLSADEKTAHIQEHISHLVKRLPHAFENDVFQEMQHLFVNCSDEFKRIRSHRHLSRMISYQYLFRREIRRLAKEQPSRRHLSLKLFQSVLRPNRKILSLVIGVNFFHHHELLDEEHILDAVREHVRSARSVEGSFIGDSARRERVRTLYLEIEKEEEAFSGEEIRLLREHLPEELKERIEHLMHPIFMPRNEEETMRDILALANQLKYVRDLPQAIIHFDEQTHTDLVFQVVVCRVRKDDSRSISAQMREKSALSYHHDRTKEVGMVRRRHPKEATVFRVSLPKSSFLRPNHSVDLQRARQHVVAQMEHAIGPFRDYNGGMIAKQSEALNAVKVLVGSESKTHEFALQNLFYNIEPPVMRNVLDPTAIQHLFKMTQKQCASLRISEDREHLYAVLDTENPLVQKEFDRGLADLHIPSIDLARTSIEVNGSNSLGLIYRSDDPEMRERFQALLEKVVTSSAMSSTL